MHGDADIATVGRWLRKARRSRAVHVSDEGRAGLREMFGVELNVFAS